MEKSTTWGTSRTERWRGTGCGRMRRVRSTSGSGRTTRPTGRVSTQPKTATTKVCPPPLRFLHAIRQAGLWHRAFCQRRPVPGFLLAGEASWQGRVPVDQRGEVHRNFQGRSQGGRGILDQRKRRLVQGALQRRSEEWLRVVQVGEWQPVQGRVQGGHEGRRGQDGVGGRQ